MTFTKEQIKELANPFEHLGTGDALAEHQRELDQLSAEEKIELATKLLINCPTKELTHYSQAIKALKKHPGNDESFHAVLDLAFQVKKRLTALYDPKNLHPYKLLLDGELQEGLYQQFFELALNTLHQNEQAIALSLAKTTPKEQRSAVARNVQNIFVDSLFASKVEAAFMVQRNLENLLLGEHPELFFTSHDFNPALLREFCELLELIDDKEEEIATKLAKITDGTRREGILAKIKSISPDVESILLEETQKTFAANPASETAYSPGIFKPVSGVKLETTSVAGNAPGL